MRSFLLLALVVCAQTSIVAAGSPAWIQGLSPTGAARPDNDGLVVKLSTGVAKSGESVSIDIQASSFDGQTTPRVELADTLSVDGLRFGALQELATRTFIEMGSAGRTASRTQVTYSLRVVPERTGEFTIPPLALRVNGKIVKAPDRPMQLRVVEDTEAQRLLFIERQPVPARVYEGEPYDIDIELGWDAGVEAARVLLQIPWWGQQDGVIELERIPSGREVAFPVGRRDLDSIPVEHLGTVTRSGAAFTGFRLRRRFIAARPGRVEFSRSILRVDRSASLSSRRAESYFLPLDPFSIEVIPVPEKNRPLEWTGAVGRIEVQRDAKVRDVDAGDVLSFELRYAGDANLEFFTAPDLERVEGFERFRVLGSRDETSPYERLITYDLVPKDASIDAIPPVPLSVFDTGLGAYVTVSSEPLPIRVRATTAVGEDPFGSAEAEAPPVPIALRDIAARPIGVAGDGEPMRVGLKAALLLLTSMLVGWRVLRRWVREQGDPSSAAARVRRGALRSLESGLSRARTPVEQAQALHGFLAARTGTFAEEWIGRSDLGAGCPSPELDQRFGEIQSDLDGAMFAGTSSGPLEAVRLVQFARDCVRSGL